MTQEPTTVRMKRAPEATLDGYVFSDDEHARTWLRPYRGMDVVLERVRVGPLKSCPRCGGAGHTQKIEKVSDLTLQELYADG